LPERVAEDKLTAVTTVMMNDGRAFLSDLVNGAGLETNFRVLNACFFMLFFPLAIENYPRDCSSGDGGKNAEKMEFNLPSL
jgi:hypothetical protein